MTGCFDGCDEGCRLGCADGRLGKNINGCGYDKSGWSKERGKFNINGLLGAVEKLQSVKKK